MLKEEKSHAILQLVKQSTYTFFSLKGRRKLIVYGFLCSLEQWMVFISQAGGHPQHRPGEGREQQGEMMEGQGECGGTVQANHLHTLSGQKKTGMFVCQK